MTPVRVLPILTTLLFPALPMQAQLLTLEIYVSQVEKSNRGLQAADLSLDATDGKLEELAIVYSPFLNAALNYTHDRSGENLESPIQANEINSLAWDLSLSKRFPSGTRVSAGYAQTRLDLDLPYPYALNAGTSLSKFGAYDIKPYLQVDQSLLKELAGGLTEIGIRKNRFLAQAGQYQQLAARQQTVLNARSAYLRLSWCRTIVKFRRESLDRAEELLRWNRDKLRLDLADPGDLLQAQAQRRQAAMELQTALDEEKDARREFNHLRDLAGDGGPEELQNLPELLALNPEADLPARQGQRADVLAARASLAAGECAERENTWSAGPELSAFGRVSLHGLDLDYPPAFRQVAAVEKPTLAVGANLSMPLDFGINAKVAQGFRSDREALQARLQQAQADADKDWALLCEQWRRAQSKLEAVREIRDLQARRLEQERKKYRQGKTTTFQLLSAENDLDQATLGLNRTMFEALLIRFQRVLYDTRPVGR